MKRRNVTLMVVGNFFCTRRVAARCDEIVGLPPDVTYRLVRTMVRTCDESSRYATFPTLASNDKL